MGGTLLLEAPDPVAAARRLGSLPGVAWIAVGYRFSGNREYLGLAALLARRYLSRGRSFRISAQAVESPESAGDLVLAGNSEVLATVKGSRVDERHPVVRFRVSVESASGAFGAEIATGPSGTPTGEEWVACLVSGGEGSSSMAWMTALSGYSVRMVHASTGDAALRRVARLYSELSFRMDPTRLELVLLNGEGAPLGRVGRWLRQNGGPAFAGFRPRRAALASGLSKEFPNVAFPLLLFQEQALAETYRSLGLGRPPARQESPRFTLEALDEVSPYKELRFGGREADISAVIDTLKGLR